MHFILEETLEVIWKMVSVSICLIVRCYRLALSGHVGLSARCEVLLLPLFWCKSNVWMAWHGEFVKKSSLSCLSSYDHLEHQYCACLVSTILWWELYFTCSHFMNFGSARALKSEALKTIYLNRSCLIRNLYSLETLLRLFSDTQMMHRLLMRVKRPSIFLTEVQECVTTANSV